MVNIYNKRGWLRIVEASIAILIVAGVIFIVIGNRPITHNPDLSKDARDLLDSVAKRISLRDEILKYDTRVDISLLAISDGLFLIRPRPSVQECF